jgi:hypothetical protein
VQEVRPEIASARLVMDALEKVMVGFWENEYDVRRVATLLMNTRGCTCLDRHHHT